MIKKITAALLIIAFLFLAGCTTETAESISIISSDGYYTVEVGGVEKLQYFLFGANDNEVYWTVSNDCVRISNSGYLIGLKQGEAVVTATVGNAVDSVKVKVIESSAGFGTLTISSPKNEITTGEKVTLNAELVTTLSHLSEDMIVFEIIDGKDCATLNGRELTGMASGTVTVSAHAENIVSAPITVRILDNGEDIAANSICLQTDREKLAVGEFATLSYVVTPGNASGTAIFKVIDGNKNVRIEGNKVYALTDGEATVVCMIGNVVSNTIVLNKNEPIGDPYVGITSSEFYANYQPAESYLDAYYRSQHGFMSGSIEEQDQEPTVSEYRPKENGLFVKNSAALYSADGNTYYVVNAYGEVVNEIYKGGGYVTLEEVAAYLMAFGNIPANYSPDKNTKPSDSPWGEYLRVNHSRFSGDTSRYPYEPALPNISGCGGSLTYYELDIGTTGNDCDPSYQPTKYNNGSKITRGASRIVYARSGKNGVITEVGERYLFYTYNHYNDFREYLNYEGGWGEMFGNITGGGKLSNTSRYNPTPYVSVTLSTLAGSETAVAVHPILFTYEKKKY